ncbi:DUF6676 family protein [Gordonia sp. Z-3]|jgi:hypothetical protein|uniref:Uncharacterized protein n=2 Tax=Gordonia TaxID=2053 RepID=A0A9X3D597_9ACTN|nr:MULTISPECIES: DUF6676 family protein [Gordonia]MAU82796.1 hypothetical protein [Gordonia sp. (in: high G+C Gram-positive bacteria)]MCF3940132.1 hypothetical protein [Gordonia tangerina]MCX2965166.1 hypothetical protein [Gordonia aquimaris]MED5800380.1 DUF6676 family protein [Gordonia sp. Z-3]
MSPDATTQHVLALPPMGVMAPSVIPESVDMPAILRDIQEDGVAAPAGQVAGLRAVVAEAQADGQEVSFVVIDRPLKFEYYRDIATDLQADVGGTVIVLGPQSVGSASPHFSRVQQEEATDNLTLTDPPLAARQMWDQMNEPSLNWTVISLLLIVIVVAGAAIARLRSTRADRRGAGGEGAAPVESTAQASGTTDLSRDLP